MRRLSMILVLLAVVPGAPGIVADEKTHSFDGHYRWDAMDGSGDLQAVFVPAGEDTWEVSFHFDFRGALHTYSGIAKGSLAAGKLTGDVFNERETRRYSFRGTVKNGKFRGTHFETTGGSRRRTGTLSMNAVD